jgi:hypothetical protein
MAMAILSRRAFLPCAVAAAARTALAAPRARVENIQTITRQPEYYHGWPTAALRANGEIVAVCSGGREAHVCPFGRVELIRSSDNARTWSWPEVLMDTPIDDRDAGVVETRAGSLLVTTFTSLAYERVLSRAENWPAERLARWQAVNRRASEQQRKALLGTWMLRSTDGGMTWSAPYRVPVNSPHGPVQLTDGRLLYAGKRLWDADAKVGVCESRDDGKTWRWLADLPVRPGDRVLDYHELHAVDAGGGRIVAQIRNENQQNHGETLQTESSDGGKTWTPTHTIGVWGLPSHLLRLRNGHLLMSYGYRRPPFGNQARLSQDGGATWSEPMTISSDGASSDLGYPSTMELTSGQLVTVWYELPNGSNHAMLRRALWSIET